MKIMRGQWMKAGTVLVAGFVLCSLGALAPAVAGQSVQILDGRDLVSRLQRLERDMRDLQVETYRRTGRPLPPGGLPPPSVEPAQPAIPDISPLMRRMSELEGAFSRLTGQIEELGHQVDQLAQRTDRMQRELAYQAQQGRGLPPGDSLAEPSASGEAVASLAPDGNRRVPPLLGPPPANLGQIPEGSSLPAPAAPSDPRQEFDAAMTLLSRAQYDQASEAFRNFAQSYPDEARAPDALYWTGYIAYSAKKDYAEAAREFAELLKQYPMAQRAPEGMLQLGLALFQLGQMREGCAALAALPARYPSASAAIATRARNERRSHMCG